MNHGVCRFSHNLHLHYGGTEHGHCKRARYRSRAFILTEKKQLLVVSGLISFAALVGLFGVCFFRLQMQTQSNEYQ